MNPRVETILERLGVVFTEHHPAVSKKCVGVDCPFCGDTGKHCGVFKDLPYTFYCWKCGTKGTLYKLIHKMTGVGYDTFCEAADIHKIPAGNTRDKLSEILPCGDIQPQPQSLKSDGVLDVAPAIPAGTVDWGTPHPGKEYFAEQRGYPEHIWKEYGCRLGLSGDWINRIVIPVPAPALGKPISHMGRSIHPNVVPKYRAWSGRTLTDVIYFTDNYFQHIFIVEGIFDAWAIRELGLGTGACVFGHQLHPGQINELLHTFVNIHPYPIITLMFDGDVGMTSVATYRKLKPLLPDDYPLNYINLPDGLDPDALYRYRAGYVGSIREIAELTTRMNDGTQIFK